MEEDEEVKNSNTPLLQDLAHMSDECEMTLRDLNKAETQTNDLWLDSELRYVLQAKVRALAVKAALTCYMADLEQGKGLALQKPNNEELKFEEVDREYNRCKDILAIIDENLT